MKNTFLKLAALAGLALGLSTSVQAVTILSYATSGVGQYAPASTYNNNIDVAYASNVLVDWYNGGSAPASPDSNGVTFDLAATSLGSLPSPLTFGYKDDQAPFDSIDTSIYEYVLGKYGDTAFLFYLGNLSGTYALPSTMLVFNPHSEKWQELGLSHEVLFNAGTTRVPDSGMTAVLLGLGLVAVSFFARRRTA